MLEIIVERRLKKLPNKVNKKLDKENKETLSHIKLVALKPMFNHNDRLNSSRSIAIGSK